MVDDIAERNRQYGELMKSRNRKEYTIETRTDGGDWILRQRSLSKDYLDSQGRRWVDGKFCTEYRIS